MFFKTVRYFFAAAASYLFSSKSIFTDDVVTGFGCVGMLATTIHSYTSSHDYYKVINLYDCHF